MGLYFLLINVVTFIVFLADKIKAKTDSWRISERTLIIFVLMGGSAGALLGMVICRHKIRNKKFAVGVPLILVVQVVLIANFILEG